MRGAKLIAAALVGAAAFAGAGSAGAAPLAPDEVRMTTSSWGRLMAGWTIDADGTGR
jgi:hypothetical protein